MKDKEKNQCDFIKDEEHPKVFRMHFKPLIPKQSDENPQEENKDRDPVSD